MKTELNRIYFHLKWKGIHKDKYIISMNYINKKGLVKYYNSSYKENQVDELFFLGLTSPENLFNEISIHDFGYFDITYDNNQSIVTCIKDDSAENIFYDKTNWEHPTEEEITQSLDNINEYDSKWIYKLYTTISHSELHRIISMSNEEKCILLGIPMLQKVREEEINKIIDGE